MSLGLLSHRSSVRMGIVEWSQKPHTCAGNCRVNVHVQSSFTNLPTLRPNKCTRIQHKCSSQGQVKNERVLWLQVYNILQMCCLYNCCKVNMQMSCITRPCITHYCRHISTVYSNRGACSHTHLESKCDIQSSPITAVAESQNMWMSIQYTSLWWLRRDCTKGP